ncbi:tripartite tricarboxylate transporter TctB family protein [Rhizobium sp. SG2393]|uniref:tripartite tricarboxylate transporter TctB family protein n=1 Tax=Rhizobium sp. SG2393 TaxID=3276279 RepID=UPI00366C0DE0
MSPSRYDRTDLLCGALFIGLGLFFAVQSLALDLGTAFRMGPGYFPFMLAILLMIFGLIILVGSFGKEEQPMGMLAWRGIFFILPAPIFFGLTVRGLGFVPSLFVTSFIAAFASGKMKPLGALALAAAITVFSVAIFSYALGLPFERFGPWVRF